MLCKGISLELHVISPFENIRLINFHGFIDQQKFLTINFQTTVMKKSLTKYRVIRTATKGQKQGYDLQHNVLTSLFHFAV